VHQVAVKFHDLCQGLEIFLTDCLPANFQTPGSIRDPGSLERAGIGEIMTDLRGLPNAIPDFKEFSKYNVQVEKIRCNAAGYIKAGPCRAPYQDLPDDWRALTVASGKAWAELCARKYR